MFKVKFQGIGNNKALWLCLLAWVLMMGCGGSPTISPVTESTTIMAYGDSLTYGTGAAREMSYPHVLEKLLGCRVVNRGVPGEVSADGLRRLPQALKEVNPNLVILCHGGNDILGKVPHQQIKENLSAMIELVQAYPAEVILIAVPQPGLRLKPPKFYRELARHYNLPIEQSALSSILRTPKQKSDQIHPNGEGYRVLSERLAELITQSQSE